MTNQPLAAPEPIGSRWRHIVILTASVYALQLFLAELIGRHANTSGYEPYDTITGDFYYTSLYAVYDVLWLLQYAGAAALTVVLVLWIARYLSGRPLIELITR